MRPLSGVFASLGVAFVAGLAIVLASGIGADAAVAAGSQMFPVKSGLVPVVVAAAFVLPAGAACLWSMMQRISGRVGTLASVGLLAALAMALLAYANPELFSVVRQTVSRL